MLASPEVAAPNNGTSAGIPNTNTSKMESARRITQSKHARCGGHNGALFPSAPVRSILFGYPTARISMPDRTRILGTSPIRKEGRAKVTGRAQYVDDITLPDMWYGATVRSTIARGRI